MKNLILAAFLMLSTIAYSQQCSELRFRKPTINSGVYKFSNVVSGVDAYVSITGSKNASVSKIDDSSSYAYAWNPFIKMDNSKNNPSDSSYVEFTIRFKKGNADTSLPCLNMTIVDLDGTNNLKEMIMSSYPVTINGTNNTAVTYSQTNNWHILYGAPFGYNSIDTSNYPAIAKANYNNINKIVLRIGVLGQVQKNGVREFSLHFKPIGITNKALPVKWLKADIQRNEINSVISWIVEEKDCAQYEICKKIDNQWQPIVSVPSDGNGINQYSTIIDNSNNAQDFYRIKQIDINGRISYSSILFASSQELIEEPIDVYDIFGVMVYSGSYTEFLKQATPNKLYYTSLGEKIIVTQ